MRSRERENTFFDLQIASAAPGLATTQIIKQKNELSAAPHAQPICVEANLFKTGAIDIEINDIMLSQVPKPILLRSVFRYEKVLHELKTRDHLRMKELAI